MISKPGDTFNPLREIPLYCEYRDCSFSGKIARIIPDAISHLKENPGDIAFGAGVFIAAASAIGITCAVAPIFLAPMIIYSPPVIGFAGYTVTNAAIGGIPGLLAGYQINKLCAAPPEDMDAWREEGWTRKIVRVAAKLQLFTLAGGALGAAFIPAAHSLKLATPLF